VRQWYLMTYDKSWICGCSQSLFIAASNSKIEFKGRGGSL